MSVIGLKNPDKLSYRKLKSVIIDVAAQAIERPVKEQQKAFNGQKKLIIRECISL